MDPITALTSLFSLAQAGISVAQQYSSVAPTIEKGIAGVSASGAAVVSDVGSLVSDLKAGKYGNTEADVAKALLDFGKATASIAGALPAVASLVSKSSSLPSVSGLSAVIKAL